MPTLFISSPSQHAPAVSLEPLPSAIEGDCSSIWSSRHKLLPHQWKDWSSSCSETRQPCRGEIIWQIPFFYRDSVNVCLTLTVCTFHGGHFVVCRMHFSYIMAYWAPFLGTNGYIIEWPFSPTPSSPDGSGAAKIRLHYACDNWGQILTQWHDTHFMETRNGNIMEGLYTCTIAHSEAEHLLGNAFEW